MNESGRDVEYLGVICMVLVTHKPADAVLHPQHRRRAHSVHRRDRHEQHRRPGGDRRPARDLSAQVRPVRRSAPARARRGDRASASSRGCANVPGLRTGGHRERAHQPRRQGAAAAGARLLQLVPQPRTRHADFFVLNTAQFVNNTLNNNEVIRTVNGFFDDYGVALRGRAAAAGRRAAHSPLITRESRARDMHRLLRARERRHR